MALPSSAKVQDNVVRNLLKELKKPDSKTLHFAFLFDGPGKGELVVSKTKMPRVALKAHAIADAKKKFEADKSNKGKKFTKSEEKKVKFLWGRLDVEDGANGTLQVTSIGKPQQTVEKCMKLVVVKQQYKGAGFDAVSFKNVEEEDDADQQTGSDAAATDQPATEQVVADSDGAPEAEADTQDVTTFNARHATLQKLTVKVAKEHPNALSDADKQKIGAILKKAQEFAGKSDFSNAGKAHDGVEQILTAAMKEVKANQEDPLALKWKSALETITPNLKQALVDGSGDTQKMKTVLAYAKEKADAGEYTSAIKSLGALEMLINEGKAEASDPLTPWKETAKNAVFQINRLQFALRSYEKQLSKEVKGAPDGEAKKMQAAMTGSLKIAEMLEEVVSELNSLPASEQDVKKLSDYMKSDIVAAAEKPNPFNLKVDITGPVSKALTELQTHFSDN